MDEAKAALEHALASSELFGAPLLVIANKQVMPLESLLFTVHARHVHTAGLVLTQRMYAGSRWRIVRHGGVRPPG